MPNSVQHLEAQRALEGVRPFWRRPHLEAEIGEQCCDVLRHIPVLPGTGDEVVGDGMGEIDQEIQGPAAVQLADRVGVVLSGRWRI